jgi:hypothetical protein
MPGSAEDARERGGCPGARKMPGSAEDARERGGCPGPPKMPGSAEDARDRRRCPGARKMPMERREWGSAGNTDPGNKDSRENKDPRASLVWPCAAHPRWYVPAARARTRLAPRDARLATRGPAGQDRSARGLGVCRVFAGRRLAARQPRPEGGPATASDRTARGRNRGRCADDGGQLTATSRVLLLCMLLDHLLSRVGRRLCQVAGKGKRVVRRPGGRRLRAPAKELPAGRRAVGAHRRRGGGHPGRRRPRRCPHALISGP